MINPTKFKPEKEHIFWKGDKASYSAKWIMEIYVKMDMNFLGIIYD